MSYRTLTPYLAPDFPQQEESFFDRTIAHVDALLADYSRLEALTDAHAILDRAAGQCAHYAAVLPYAFLSHARDYIARQADELVQPIFQEVL